MEQLERDLFPLSSFFSFGPSGVSWLQHYKLWMIIKLSTKNDELGLMICTVSELC